MNKYWYVYKVGGGAPYYRHYSKDGALEEAKRLVDAVGGVFEVLEIVALVQPAPKHYVYTFDDFSPVSDGIPF